MASLITHEILVGDFQRNEYPRNSIGGFPILPQQLPYPECRCGQRMTLFLQFDIQECFGLPLVSGSHFSLFQCLAHSGPPRNQWGGWGADSGPFGLPPEYWIDNDDPAKTSYEASYALMLHRPTDLETMHAEDPFIVPKSLTFEKLDEVVEDNGESQKVVPAISRAEFSGTSAFPWDDEHGAGLNGRYLFKVGGQPRFLQKTEKRICACGADMIFLCQIPEPDGVFEFTSAAPTVENLFLDLFVTIFACEKQCSPFALHAEGQR